jgi:alpha-ketoglutarate-dependent taurine dioxygenase
MLLETSHHPVPEIATTADDWEPLTDLVRTLPAGTPVDEALVDLAGDARRLLPTAVRRALEDLRVHPGPAGAVLVTGIPLGHLPATPDLPTSPTDKEPLSELVLLTVGRALGEPVGYLAEHGGATVQNLLPVRGTEATQTSTSSAVDLEFHTETAFHPHRPHYLLLTCLRGDAAASTYLCSVHEVLDHLTPRERTVLGERRFRTRVDESFGGTPQTPPTPPVAVLSGDPGNPTLLFDADLMDGTDPEADAALRHLSEVAHARRLGVVLQPGDLLVVDNHACIHGRSSFAARYDGTDRWLQRAFVVDDLAPSAPHRTGRTIDLDFTDHYPAG